MKKRVLKRALSVLLVGVLALGNAFVATKETVYGFVHEEDENGCTMTEVNFDIIMPTVGDFLTSKGIIDYPWYSQLGEIEWYKEGEKIDNPSQTKAEADVNYSILARLQVNDKKEWKFAEDVVAYVNGSEAQVREYGKYNKEDVIEVFFDEVYIYDTLKEVSVIGIDRPKIGCTTDMDVESLEPEKYDITPYNDYEVKWYENGYEMTPDSEFEEGNCYSVVIDLRVKDGYRFNCNRYWYPDMEAYIDGNEANLSYGNGSPVDAVQLSYDFNLLDSEGIEYVNIYDLPYPIVGNNPEYKVGELGGCAYYIPDLNENEYQKNGIAWMDVTDPSNEFFLTEEDEFLMGHHYKIIMDMVTEDGHVFVPDDEDWDETVYAIDITGYGIGEPVSLESFEGESDTHKKISFIYDCQPVTVDEINVYDLDLPVGGEKPDYTANVDNYDFYKIDEDFGVNGVEWSNIDGTVMEEGDSFVEGEIYNVKVKVIPRVEEGEVKALIDGYIDGFVNYGKGECIVEYDGDDEYNFVKKYAYINRTFICAKGEELSATLSSMANEYKVGETITLQANAAGGSGEYTYKFAMFNVDSGVWTVLNDFSNNSICIYNLKNAGTYQFALTVKDSKGNTAAAQRLSVNIKEDENKFTAILKGNGSTGQISAGKGAILNLNVEASGGNSGYTYKFAVLNVDNGKWSVLKDFSPESTYTYALNYPGTKQFAVTVKDNAGNTVATNRLTVVVQETKSPLTAALSVDGSTDKLTVSMGTNMKLSVMATGGSGEYTYKFAVLNVETGIWYVLRDFNQNSEYSYAFNYPGTKQFAVTVKDSKGNTVAANRLTVVVK